MLNLAEYVLELGWETYEAIASARHRDRYTCVYINIYKTKSYDISVAIIS